MQWFSRIVSCVSQSLHITVVNHLLVNTVIGRAAVYALFPDFHLSVHRFLFSYTKFSYNEICKHCEYRNARWRAACCMAIIEQYASMGPSYVSHPMGSLSYKGVCGRIFSRSCRSSVCETVIVQML